MAATAFYHQLLKITRAKIRPGMSDWSLLRVDISLGKATFSKPSQPGTFIDLMSNCRASVGTLELTKAGKIMALPSEHL